MTLCPYGHLPVLQGVTPLCGEMSRSDKGDVAVSLLSLWSGQGLTALVGCGAKPHIKKKPLEKIFKRLFLLLIIDQFCPVPVLGRAETLANSPVEPTFSTVIAFES